MIAAVSTYQPTWAGPRDIRVAGPDEDAVTMAVAAGRAALALVEPPVPVDAIERVVVVSRDLPLLEGGNASALLAGLGLPSTVEVVERLGGAPAALDAVATAPPGTLILAVDVAPAGAGAVLVTDLGGTIDAAGRIQRSLPLRVRDQGGHVFADDDPRLQRERGLRASVELADLPTKPLLIAGLSAKDAAKFCAGDPVELPTTGASAAVFALAALVDAGAGAGAGLVAAVEQAAFAAATFDPSDVAVARIARPAIPVAARRLAPGPDIKIAFTAYARAYDSKLRFLAGCCPSCSTLAFPQRHRCLGCGAEGTSTLVDLPRSGVTYTSTTIHIPVPGLASPYTLAVIQLDGVDVRTLVQVTDAPGDVDIDIRGDLVFRRVAVRSGVPDYGYAFAPEVSA